MFGRTRHLDLSRRVLACYLLFALAAAAWLDAAAIRGVLRAALPEHGPWDIVLAALEPLMIVALGVVVAFVVMSVMLPVFDFATAAK